MKIKEAILKTRDINSMKNFYTEILGMPLTKESEDKFQVLVGSSLLEFTSRNVEDEPFYHFDF